MTALSSRAAMPGPTPEGWYFLGREAELKPGGLRTLRLAGDEWVLWRAAAGDIHLQSAWCPHLGAHLGHGGRVDGERVVCPFHGFAFNGQGACVATGYGTKPPRQAHLPSRPAIALHGLIFGWLGQGQPDWRPDPGEVQGWSDFRIHSWELRGHPQETSENSVDVGHFAHVHGYDRVQTLQAARAQGALLSARYSFEKPLPWGRLREEIEIAVWGLGYSRVEVEDKTFGARFRLMVMPTPLEADRIRLSIGIAVQDPGLARRAPWRFVPRWLARSLVSRIALRVYAADVERDFRIWKNKSWLERPALAEGDGPIGPYRAWARQFYPTFVSGSAVP
jgi:nitrite reductase/ring-hydroxylating ferredoxin subunit